MRSSLVFSVFLICAFSGSPARGQTEIEIVADSKTYGEFPIAYREIITKWLETRLLDAASAVIEWEEPKTGEVPGPKKGQRLVGYAVDFKVNSRNRFGTYTGKQKYRVLIRNGEILWGGRPPKP